VGGEEVGGVGAGPDGGVVGGEDGGGAGGGERGVAGVAGPGECDGWAGRGPLAVGDLVGAGVRVSHFAWMDVLAAVSCRIGLRIDIGFPVVKWISWKRASVGSWHFNMSGRNSVRQPCSVPPTQCSRSCCSKTKDVLERQQESETDRDIRETSSGGIQKIAIERYRHANCCTPPIFQTAPGDERLAVSNIS
jgi:hypothetical protein